MGEPKRVAMAAMPQILITQLAELNEDLIYILGRPNFVVASLAREFREDGAQIRPRAEDEQAFIIHKLLLHYLRDPVHWRDNFNNEVGALLERRRKALDAQAAAASATP